MQPTLRIGMKLLSCVKMSTDLARTEGMNIQTIVSFHGRVCRLFSVPASHCHAEFPRFRLTLCVLHAIICSQAPQTTSAREERVLRRWSYKLLLPNQRSCCPCSIRQHASMPLRVPHRHTHTHTHTHREREREKEPATCMHKHSSRI